MKDRENLVRHITGESVFINDMDVGSVLLHGRVVYSKYAYAKIKTVDTSKAVMVPGVVAIITAADIPGVNQMGPVFHDEPCMADGKCIFIGQAVALIAAETKASALLAEDLIAIEYELLDPVLTLEEAMSKGNLMQPLHAITAGDPEKEFLNCNHIMEGRFTTGGQEHWYLETQTCLCVPGEGSHFKVYSSTQHPAETQKIIAQVLGLKVNQVEVEVKRLGGGFGGKETQGNHVAAWCALLAYKTRKPVKIHLDRQTDQVITGKRHRMIADYKAGFSNEGRIIALDIGINLDGGATTDLSVAILDRALFHADNAYFVPNMKVTGSIYKTNLPPNTAFRGFGAPQGMAVIENIIDRIARFLKKDAADIRRINFYGLDENNITHYSESIGQNRLHLLFGKIVQSSSYHERRKSVDAFNRDHKLKKRGLALVPVKFGISFTTSFLNQAGALVNLYTDGTAVISHGGIEMGQGLNVKIARIASAELGLPLEKIHISPANTYIIPNTSATAASSGTDLNGMAVKMAIDKLKSRLSAFAAEIFASNGSRHDISENDIEFANDQVFASGRPEVAMALSELLEKAHKARISLSATGYYRTPGIHMDWNKGKGHPFYYYSFSMAVSEVELDLLTGDHSILRSDILFDLGDPVHELIDRGQIEGGFVQGIGWCTCEYLRYDKDGRLLTDTPDTYKIPTINEIPKIFNVEILKGYPNEVNIRHSKAIGEPPFPLALSVWFAIKEAIAAAADHEIEPDLNIPATKEEILLKLNKIKH